MSFLVGAKVKSVASLTPATAIPVKELTSKLSFLPSGDMSPAWTGHFRGSPTKRTNRTIQLIDVIWLRGHTIVAAFEIESTTSIYSGLLRMADLVAMQPNLNIPLYLGAPDERREKVITEVNRPTFSRLSPKRCEICRYISFDGLRDRIKQAAAFIKFLKPEFLEDLSESCEIDD